MRNAKPKEMHKGFIVKIETKHLFDEHTERRNKAPWIYGVIGFLEDVCKETKESAWNIKCAGNHLYMKLDSFSHLCAVIESDLILARRLGKGDCALDKYKKTSDFFSKGKKESGS